MGLELTISTEVMSKNRHLPLSFAFAIPWYIHTSTSHKIHEGHWKYIGQREIGVRWACGRAWACALMHAHARLMHAHTPPWYCLDIYYPWVWDAQIHRYYVPLYVIKLLILASSSQALVKRQCELGAHRNIGRVTWLVPITPILPHSWHWARYNNQIYIKMCHIHAKTLIKVFYIKNSCYRLQ